MARNSKNFFLPSAEVHNLQNFFPSGTEGSHNYPPSLLGGGWGVIDDLLGRHWRAWRLFKVKLLSSSIVQRSTKLNRSVSRNGLTLSNPLKGESITTRPMVIYVLSKVLHERHMARRARGRHPTARLGVRAITTRKIGQRLILAEIPPRRAQAVAHRVACMFGQGLR